MDTRVVLCWILPLLLMMDMTMGRRRGCMLGGKSYKVGDRWSPRLEPRGIMYCVICECQPVLRKGVLSRRGRVNCKNVKNECPEVTCPNPIRPKNQCCKYCSADGPPDLYKTLRRPTNGYISTDSVTTPRRLGTEFMALMVGRSDLTEAATNTVARARLSLTESTLSYTITFVNLVKPRFLRFTDDHGNILHEKDIQDTGRREYKICGEWRNIGPNNMKNLQDVKMYVSIVTSQYAQGEAGGRVEPHRALDTETFMALLAPEQRDGSGALAMFTFNKMLNEIHFIIKSVGFLRNSASRLANVSFERRRGKSVRKLQLTKDPDMEEFTGVWDNIPSRVLRQMGRGKLAFSMATEEGKTLRGKVTPRITCNVLVATLSGSDAYRPTRAGSAASALVNVLPNGRVKFQVNTAGLSAILTYLTIEGDKPRSGRAPRLCKITKFYQAANGSSDGEALGTCKRADALQLHQLLSGKLYVNAGLQGDGKSSIRGRLQELVYDATFPNRADNHVVLSGGKARSRIFTGAAGQAWLVLDKACVLHYQVLASGYATVETGSVSVYLRNATVNYRSIASRSDYTEKLGDLSRQALKGVIDGLSDPLYRAMGKGTAEIVIATKDLPKGEIMARVTLPNKCYKKENNLNSINVLDDRPPATNLSSLGCTYRGRRYKDGDSWVPGKAGSCKTCSCKAMMVICHDTVCPTLTCQKQVKPPGECCPQCQEGASSKEKCFFNGDKRWHNFGTTWHPYVPPFGYIKCAVCSCSRGTSPYNCTRIQCPHLDCQESEAFKRNKDDCCKVCPEKREKSKSSKERMQKDVGASGRGCKFHEFTYPHGARWHPRVPPFGTLKCITCSCKDGIRSCERAKCPRLRCKKAIRITSNCCPMCADAKMSTNNKKRSRRRKRPNRYN